jgi:hypothetical protein
MNVAFPYRVDGHGRTAEPENDDAHIRDLIEQVLFTVPGSAEPADRLRAAARWWRPGRRATRGDIAGAGAGPATAMARHPLRIDG